MERNSGDIMKRKQLSARQICLGTFFKLDGVEREPEYTSARAWADKGSATKWEDLDEETRTRIAQQLTVINQQLAETMKPVIEAITATVLPVVRNYSDFMPSVAKVAESLVRAGDLVRRWVPNWSAGVDPETAWAVTQEGIPLAFVPRAQVVDELVAANDRDERREIVLRSKELILDDCRAALVLDEGDRGSRVDRYAGAATRRGLRRARGRSRSFRLCTWVQCHRLRIKEDQRRQEVRLQQDPIEVDRNATAGSHR
jgi:hypothetical protein